MQPGGERPTPGCDAPGKPGSCVASGRGGSATWHSHRGRLRVQPSPHRAAVLSDGSASPGDRNGAWPQGGDRREHGTGGGGLRERPSPAPSQAPPRRPDAQGAGAVSPGKSSRLDPGSGSSTACTGRWLSGTKPGFARWAASERRDGPYAVPTHRVVRAHGWGTRSEADGLGQAYGQQWLALA